MAKTIKRHPIFYFHDGSIILQAENTLYNVYRRTLGIKSLFFASMLSLPSAAELSSVQKEGVQAHVRVTGSDGGSDSTALQLPHTVAEVDELFGFIFNEAEWSLDTPQLEGLCSLLKLSTFYLVDSGRKNALHYLSDHPDLRPALRLHLACAYNIEMWVGLAFRELMAQSILNVTLADEMLMGPAVYRALVKTQAAVDLHRHRLAFGPPRAVHDTDCRDHEDCTKTWNEAWWGKPDRAGILTALLHPVLRLPGQVIDSQLQQMQVDWGMGDACRLLTISSFQGTDVKPGRLTLEESLIEKAVASLVKMM